MTEQRLCLTCHVTQTLDQFRYGRTMCRSCQKVEARARWHRNFTPQPDTREPELNWTPTSYGLPKELTAWSLKPAPAASLST